MNVHVYDIGIKVPGHYTDSIYDDMSQFLEEVLETYGLEWESSGWGFGVRDAQLRDVDGRTDKSDEIKEMAKRYDLELEYISWYDEKENMEE